MKLIQLSTLELEQRLSREIEENPALDNTKETQELENEEFDYNKESDEHDSVDDEIDISDYLNDDEIPDYNLRTNNYSEDNDAAIPFASGTSFNHYLKSQLHSFSFNEDDLKLIDDKAKKIIQEFQIEISKLDNFNREILEPIMKNLIKKNETNFKGIGQPLRIMLTGSKFGPGLYDILISLGLEEVKKRLGTKII